MKINFAPSLRLLLISLLLSPLAGWAQGEKPMDVLQSIPSPELRTDLAELLTYVPAPPEKPDLSGEPLSARLQYRVDAAFGSINNYLIPVLFRDVSFGLFDPSAAKIQAEIDQLKLDLQDEKETEQVRLIKKALAKMTATLETINTREEARTVGLPAAREALAAYRALLAEQRSPELDKQLKVAEKALKKKASGSINGVPLIVVFLLLGGVFFTIRYGFVNVRLFRHSIQVIRGRYDDPEDHGEISHFQALTSALSATVGLGNIAGVAIAISQGGAGAVFWMWVVAFFGMSSKFSSCTLAQLYRRIYTEAKDHGRADAKHTALPGKPEHVLGGPMVYLSEGMKDVLGKSIGAPVGKILAILFAFFAIMGSLGGGNMFQGNQTFAIVGDVIFEQRIENKGALLDRIENGDATAERELAQAELQARKLKAQKKGDYAWVGGLVMTILVGMVIVGGIKRIGSVTSKLVPAMCLFYVGVCLVIVLANVGDVPALFADIFKGAFSREALSWGGLMGVLVIGVKRGAFSNEAGLGSAAIAHSAAKTKEPVREGVVAMVGPFIDTIVVCTMTALAILITDAHTSASAAGFSNEGVGITATAFSSLAPWLTYMLTLAVFIFAYSTMISWSYYGERASEYLFGHKGIWPYRIVFLVFVFIAPMISLDNVITFTDLLILSMAYPNIVGMVILSGRVAAKSKDYLSRLTSGEMKPYAGGN